jgi:hypothetical protein
MNIDELIIKEKLIDELPSKHLLYETKPLVLTEYTLKSTKLKSLQKIILDPPITNFMNAVLLYLS